MPASLVRLRELGTRARYLATVHAGRPATRSGLILILAALVPLASSASQQTRTLFGADYSARSLQARIEAMDPAVVALGRRFDPYWVEISGRWPANSNSLLRIAPDVPVLRWQDLTPREAVLINASVPVSIAPNPPARPFVMPGDSEADTARAQACLTAAVYYEAASEPLEGQQAVAQVVLNRLRHPAYPKTVCGVVFQGQERTTGCQFTFTCDGSLARAPDPLLWARAATVAKAALAGHVMKGVGNATHYHTRWVVPYWSPSLVKVANVGAHVFYRWSGAWGTSRFFRGAYAGDEAWLDRINLPQMSTPLVVAPVQPEVAEAPPIDPIVVPAAPEPKVTAALEPAPQEKAAPAEAAPPPAPAPAGARSRPRLARPSGW